ncbi:MAG: methymalonyl-coa mutase c-terminal domain protein [Cyanobacteria bacterium RYN_339]|nr:methymalonyl-coa mutase c-terminal domain protein [Cyanobacteria bacterium RYN_339]
MINPYPGIGPIDHIGIAVVDLEAALRFYHHTLGLAAPVIEEVPDQMVRTAIFGSGDGRIELLESTDPDGPIAKFIAKRGEGIHHVALRVTDVKSKLMELEAQGVTLIDRTPRIGAGGHHIAFVHPKATGGVLLELCQHCEPDPQEPSRH